MASGLQCPGCGHVHPAGLPEIARGDATFRCYGCYRTLSVPEGWTGRPAPRPAAPDPGLAAGAPPGAGTRDARSARLAGRRGFWPASHASGADAATQMVPIAGAEAATIDVGTVDVGTRPGEAPAGRAGGWPGGAGGTGEWRAGAGAPRRGGPSARSASGTPLGWVAPRRSGRPVPAALRALVWTVAFAAGFGVTAILLRAAGLLGVNTAIDLYAGTGLRRFGVLLVMLPLWAVLSATMAHFTLEALSARRRRRRPAPADTSAPA